MRVRGVAREFARKAIYLVFHVRPSGLVRVMPWLVVISNRAGGAGFSAGFEVGAGVVADFFSGLFRLSSWAPGVVWRRRETMRPVHCGAMVCQVLPASVLSWREPAESRARRVGPMSAVATGFWPLGSFRSRMLEDGWLAMVASVPDLALELAAGRVTDRV